MATNLQYGSATLHLTRESSTESVGGYASKTDMSQRKSRIIWDQSLDKTFLDACIHEVTTNRREGSALKPNSWKVVAEKLLKEHGLVVDQKQMRNRYDYYKGKYQAWVKLKSKTGNIYDPLTNKFNLTDKQWETETKLNKIVGALKTVPLLFPDLCTQLFGGSTCTDFDS
ncbi:L10-interacting MYB domain-containing protein-like [Lactuca sativa]|uniref:L10-interacting MYB domain-containing protein-like n=1 Tax=Lactuca sativa TaxID=4236 RepID=UPI000CD9CA09|nr:L10-interacting MYB domain-containing protein-like [Lactuca sativa]